MQCECSGCLVVVQQISSTKEDLYLFLLLRSLCSLIGMATGLRESGYKERKVKGFPYLSATGKGRQRGWGTGGVQQLQ